MLKQLHVSNYALIDKITVDFFPGLTAITGETGSGKSILLGAFGLLLGERADSKSIKDAASKCIVEAIFDLSKLSLGSFFEEHDLDFDVITTVRREIAPNGKSRAFINDTPVPLATLRALGELLVDIHSQHQNSILGERVFQFSVVDAFASNKSLLEEYRSLFHRYKSAKKELDDCIANESKMRQELDYLRFQYHELESAKLEDLKPIEWESELDTLNNSELIRSTIELVTRSMEEEQGVLTSLNRAKQSLSKISTYNPQLEEFSKRTEICLIDLRELTRELESFQEGLNYDPTRIEQLNEALGKLYQLQHKHQVQDIETLKELRNEIGLKIGGGESLEERIESLKNDLRMLQEELNQVSVKISQSRQKAARAVEKEVEKYFGELYLQHAELKVEIVPSEDFNAYGKDAIQFLFKANKGGSLHPIQSVASGGEISRVMLAIKASISHYHQLPVLILDEIDQGVSGETGKKIGSILKDMSSSMQLITITHLPQIAGKADQHLKVYKVASKDSTATLVKSLSGDDRIHEIAEMLNGKDYTEAAKQNARELMH